MRVDASQQRLDEAFVAAGGEESLPARAALDRLRQRLFDVDVLPTKVGRFRLLEVLGRGASAVVHAAYDPKLDRKVALKVFSGAVDRQRAASVRREARLAAGLNHPNIVTVHDVGETDGRLWVAMELIDGQTLRGALATVPRRWQDLAPFFLPVAAGLEAAHRCGVVHRDIKPENILVGRDGRVVVADFGVATPQPAPTQPGGGPVSGGTPAYMSPEQLEGRRVGASSDQFSFCVTLFEALVGARPFSGKSGRELLDRMRTGPRGPLAATGIPRSVCRALARGLSFDAGARFSSMSALVAGLESRPRRGPVLLVLGSGLALALASVTTDHETCVGGEHRSRAVWNESRRDALATSFEAVDSAFARDTWSRVEPALDDFAKAWADVHQQACESSLNGTGSDTSLDASMRCLASQLVELDATLEALEAKAPATLERAASMVATLPRSGVCLNAEGTDDHWATRPESVPVEHAILNAEVALRAGQYERAATAASSLALQAEALSQRRLRGRALLVQGTAELHQANIEAAAASLEQALFLAVAEDDDATQIHAALNLASTASMDPAAARRWVSYAKARVARGGVSKELRAVVLDREGTLLTLSGNRDEAARCFEEAFELLDELGRVRTADGARLVLNMAQLAMLQHRFDDAESKQRLALEIREELLGPMHPSTGTALAALGTVLIPQRKLEEAEALLRRSMDVFLGSVGRTHPYYTRAQAALGALLIERGDFSSARPLFVAYLARLESTHPLGHPDMVMPLQNLAMIDALEGRLDLAAESSQRVLRLAQEQGGASADVVGPMHNLAGIRMMQHELTAASELLEACVALAEAGGFSAQERSKYRTRLGEVRLLEGRNEDAEKLFLEARDLDDRTLEPRDGLRRRALLGLGVSAAARGDNAMALEVLEATMTLENGEGVDPIECARADFELASVLLEVGGDPERILGLARSAHRRLADAPPHEVSAAHGVGLLRRERLDETLLRAESYARAAPQP